MQEVDLNNQIDVRASLGIVKDFAETVDQIHDPDASVMADVHIDMLKHDPVLATAMDITVDVTTANGFTFSGKNKRQIEETQKFFEQDLDFDRVVDNIIYQLIIYGNAYMELRKIGRKIKEIHPLEPTQMSIKYDKHGRILGYVQKSGNSEDPDPTFKPDEVIFFRLKWIGSRVFSLSPLESMGTAFTTKILAQEYLQTIFKNLPPKMLHILKNASKEQRESYIANLLRSKRNPNIDLIAIGDVEAKTLVPNFDEALLTTLKVLREEVLMVTRVPPIFVGLPDNTNRSSSEALSIPFETRVRKIQSIIASQINRELMPKLGMQNVNFRFNPPSLADEKAIVENARQLRDMRIDDDTIISYLRKKGFHTLPETKFKEEQSIMNKDAMPSRVRENKKTDKMTNNLDKKGVSAEGKKKLIEKQMSVRSTIKEEPTISKKWSIGPDDVDKLLGGNNAIKKR